MHTISIYSSNLALGDLIVIITFGPISVLFAYIAQIGSFSKGNGFNELFSLIMFALPLALNTEAILHSNNVRDLEEDKKAGIFTMAIYLGFSRSYILYVLLLFVPYLVFLCMGIQQSIYYFLPLMTIFMAFELEKDFRYRRLTLLPVKTAKLNLVFGLFYVLACFMSGSVN